MRNEMQPGLAATPEIPKIIVVTVAIAIAAVMPT